MDIDHYIAKASIDGWIAQHREQYETDPTTAHMWDSSTVGGPGPVPTLLLTTIGRRTGQPRKVPLIYGADGDDYVVIASKGGTDQNPAWYYNLEAADTVTVQVAEHEFEARTRLATGEERTRIWSNMTEIYPPYDDYQARTLREIPVIVLSPTR